MELSQLIEALDGLLQHLPDTGSRTLALGYSGGVDSEVLAFVLSEYIKEHPEVKAKLVYVHHGLSTNADDWQTHCHQRAQKYQLPFIAKHVVVKRGARLSLEAEARKVRYQAFLEAMSDGDVLLTAHHQDDQLETLLLALKRGQGPKGLGAMAQVQPFYEKYWQLRPLLSYSKDDIIEFAQQHQLKHIEDESNRDTKFDRNFLRRAIIPQLKQRWPAIAETISRSALLCQQQETLLNEVSQEKLQQHISSSPYAKRVLNLDRFNTLSLAWQRQLLRTFIEQNKLPVPSMVQLDQTIAQLSQSKADASVELNHAGVVIRRFKKHVYVSQKTLDFKLKRIKVETINLEQVILLEDGRELEFRVDSNAEQGLRLPKLGEKVSIHFGAVGSMICHPNFRHKPRQLKKLWQELNVPPWERGRVPLIYFDEQLVAAVGLWIEKRAISNVKPSLKIRLL